MSETQRPAPWKRRKVADRLESLCARLEAMQATEREVLDPHMSSVNAIKGELLRLAARLDR
jgi:hypothetical protein